jgi:aminoglycoside phosphotransferase
VTEGDWPAEFRPVLRKLVADGRQYFGADRVAVEPVRTLERPFSTLLQIRIAPEAGRPAAVTDAFVKILKPRADTPAQIASMRQNVVKDFEVTSRVQRGLSVYPGLMAVRPIACFPEDLAIVTERAQGTTLSDRLARGAVGWPRARTMKGLSATLRQIGAWLRAAQASFPQDGAIPRESIAAYLDKRLDELERSAFMRLTARGRGAIEAYRDRLFALVPAELNPVWIHADFCPENIIIAPEGTVTVLDFTMAKSGTLYTDLAHLYLRLDAMKAKPWFRPPAIDRLRRELLDAFEPGLTDGRPLFALMLLQHVICHLVGLHEGESPLARVYNARLHRRHRAWLRAVAGVDEHGWRRSAGR